MDLSVFDMAATLDSLDLGPDENAAMDTLPQHVVQGIVVEEYTARQSFITRGKLFVESAILGILDNWSMSQTVLLFLSDDFKYESVR